MDSFMDHLFRARWNLLGDGDFWDSGRLQSGPGETGASSLAAHSILVLPEPIA